MKKARQKQRHTHTIRPVSYTHLHTRMKFLAIKKNMSLKDIVNEAMKEYLEKNEQ